MINDRQRQMYIDDLDSEDTFFRAEARYWLVMFLHVCFKTEVRHSV